MPGFDVAGYDQALAAAHQNIATVTARLAVLREAYGESQGIAALSWELWTSWPAVHLASCLAALVAKNEETT